MRTEEWGSLPMFDGYYEVSNFGNVRSLDRVTQFGNRLKSVKGRVLKPKTRTGKYRSVIMSFEGKYYSREIHRLVALIFVPNPEKLPCVNHIDGDKDNNVFTNLEWETHAGNTKHAMDTGLIKNVADQSVHTHLSNDQVLAIRAKYIPKVYTIKMLAAEYGLGRTTVRHIIKRNSWKTI